MNLFKGKTIIFGVTGGIAIYKSINLVSFLRRHGAKVHVVMTDHAMEFVKPLTFKTVSENKVITGMFNDEGYVTHISLTEKADLFIVAPATANIIAKFRTGIADDMLSTMFLAYDGPVMIVPSMNDNMYKNKATEENLKILSKRGIKIVEPVEGLLATGKVGKGRFPSDDIILYYIEKILYKNELKNKSNKLKAIVTLGATREYIDPVRFISNPSSGKTGYFYAKYLDFLGFNLKVIAGNYNYYKIDLFNPQKITSTSELLEKILDNIEDYDLLVMSAAVSDFTPAKISDEKIKKQNNQSNNQDFIKDNNLAKNKDLTKNKNLIISKDLDEKYFLELVRTKDVLTEVRKRNKNIKILGFAAETSDIESNGIRKLKEKQLDAICINQVYKEDKGFQSDKNTVVYIDKFNNREIFENLDKEEIAKKVIEKFVRTFF